ncbi:hypothetical protein [Brasilonema sp. UFV-L1]|uniref:hypothetical protein n=1 Tax=Brasilonema sp. UFV-L1 TaxID=2234130 RepID=UPI00145CA628|nr:hypothetical protein [Brasilonema sp. UFV-L1]NMG06141.1 hypothetical protein [Brasilonema sp. UFV-L1]
MLLPDSPGSAEALFASIEEGIHVCHNFRDGTIEVSIRKISPEELELRVSSLRGCFRCPYGELKNYLEQFPQDTQSQVSVYRDRFRVELISILSKGFGLLQLDFSKSKKGRTPPVFGAMVTELLDVDC